MSNSNSLQDDTIAAIATPPGRGGVGIVRLSGADIPRIAAAVLGKMPPARRAVFGNFLAADGTVLDQGIALYFEAPRSFTGEHVLELHGHGGQVILDMILRRIVSLGARLARPGEFSERAFLNDRLDLAQAEAIADLIDSGTQEAARAAMRSLQGEFSAQVNRLVDAVTQTRVYIEAAIDFPDEDIDFLADATLHQRVDAIDAQFIALADAARQGCLLNDGLNVVIAGPPNAGKSSLMNRLAGYDAAIVTDIPGTTRDMLRETIHIDGMPLHLTDTAGLRVGGEAIEREGMRRARGAMSRADRVLVIEDAAADTSGVAEDLPPGVPVTRVVNKIDLTDEEPRFEDGEPPRIYLSAKTGNGMLLLTDHLRDCAGYQGAGAGTLSARRRHLDALERASAHVTEARQQLVEAAASEIAAEELRLAQRALGEITGQVTSDDLLGEIFSSFCIGK